MCDASAAAGLCSGGVGVAVGRVSRGLKGVLLLADAAADAGDMRDAAELVLGALDDLSRDLGTLAAFLNSNR